MRLSERDAACIREAVQATFGTSAEVRLFGSRVDDAKRGGDIDLYIETDLAQAEALVEARLALLTRLWRELGEQKIDPSCVRAARGRMHRSPGMHGNRGCGCEGG